MNELTNRAQLERRLADRKVLHEKMRAINAALGQPDAGEQIIALGYTEEYARQIIRDGGFTPDEFETNLKEISRITLQIAALHDEI
nr:hypothetical protein [uncultured Arsenicibacter sp.]